MKCSFNYLNTLGISVDLLTGIPKYLKKLKTLAVPEIPKDFLRLLTNNFKTYFFCSNFPKVAIKYIRLSNLRS
jgi:hypothetical protein